MKLTRNKSGFHLTGAVLLACCAMLPARADYQSTVTAQSPAGYWRLNETVVPPPSVSATNLGSVGALGYGTYSATVKRGVPGGLAGDTDAAAGFAGTSADNVRVPYTPGLNPTTFTVEFWSKPRRTGVFSCPVSSTDFTATPLTRLGWLFYQDDGGVAAADAWVFRPYATGNASRQVASPAGLVTTNWQHVVGIVSATDVYLYVNGVQVATRALSGTYAPVADKPLSLGVRYDNGFPLDGSLDEVAIYPTALSEARVLAHYMAGTNSAPAVAYRQEVLNDSPAGYWRLSELEGPPAANLGTLGSDGNGNYMAGAIVGQAGPAPATYPGFDAANKAVSFDKNTAGAVKLPALNLNTNTVTITAWVKPNGAQDPLAGIVFNRAGATVSGLHIDGYGNFGVGYTWNNDPASYNWYPANDSGLSTLTDGAWNFVAVSVDANQAAVYMANTALASSFMSVTNTISHASQAFEGATIIGQDAGYTNRIFNGLVDEVTIFGRPVGAGDIYSQFATAIGGVPAKIFTDPQTPANPVYVGDTLVLSVDAGGTAPISYQWRRGVTTLTDQTNSVLSITNVQLTDSGDYTVSVQGSVGGAVVSAPASVTINPLTPPAVSVGLQGRTLYPGGTLNLSVTASGGSLTYFWSRNGTVVAAGASSGYSVPSVTSAEAGTYSVLVSNSVGTASSGPVTLVVPTPDAGSFEEAIVNDQPRAWYRLDETAGSQTLWDAMGRHDGTWIGTPTLGAAGISGNSAVSFDRTAGTYGSVPYSPAINTTDFTLECWVKTTDLVNLICPVSSRANTKGEWFYTFPSGKWSGGVSDSGNNYYVPSTTPGSTILSGEWTHMAISYGSTTNGSLRVYFNGQWDNAGYVDFERNGSGPLIIGARGVSWNAGTGSTVDYNMNGIVDEVVYFDRALSPAQILNHFQAGLYGANTAPIIKTQPQSRSVIIGQNASFSAYVQGSLPLAYQWAKNGTPITGATTSAYSITSAGYAHVGDYRLIVTNTAGAVTSVVATLTVAPVPTFANATNGLVLHLRFDGDYQDSSGRGNNGTAQGSPTITAGKIGTGAVRVNTDTTAAIYDYVSLGSPADLLFGATTSFSVSYWIKMPANAAPGDLPVLCSAVNSYGNKGITFAPSYQGGGWSWNLGDGTVNAGLYGADNSINNGQWHSLVHTFDRSSGLGTTYLDGLQVDQTSFATVGDIDTAGPFNIGQDPTGGYPESATFEVDDLAVWRTVLTPAQAQAIYYTGQSGTSFDTFQRVTLNLTPVSGTLVLSWQTGTLMESTSPTGPWTPVAGATAPNYIVTPPQTGAKFYIVQQ